MIIWLASYPRSGNTFLRILMKKVFGINTYSVYNDSHDISLEPETKKVVGHEILPNNFSYEEAEKSSKIYCIKTHELPSGNEKKIIYLLRDGRESITSYFQYLKNYHTQSYTLNEIIEGIFFRSSWGDHVREWRPIEAENTLLIKFEDLIENPDSFIDKLSKFIGIEHLQDVNIPTFDELQQINPKFFRSGKKNSWKTKLTQQELLNFWTLNYFEMITYGYNNDVPEIFKNSDMLKSLKMMSDAFENKYNRVARQHQFAKNYSQLIKNINDLFSNNKKYILYGGGQIAHTISQFFPLQIEAILDQNPNNSIMNPYYAVVEPKTLLNLPSLPIIITVIGRELEIQDQLIKSGIPSERIITLINSIK